LYLINLSESANSVSKIDEAFYALSWAHKLAGVPDPCKNDLVVSVREGAHRKIVSNMSTGQVMVPVFEITTSLPSL
jgi:hypothetical protein